MTIEFTPCASGLTRIKLVQSLLCNNYFCLWAYEVMIFYDVGQQIIRQDSTLIWKYAFSSRSTSSTKFFFCCCLFCLWLLYLFRFIRLEWLDVLIRRESVLIQQLSINQSSCKQAGGNARTHAGNSRSQKKLVRLLFMIRLCGYVEWCFITEK